MYHGNKQLERLAGAGVAQEFKPGALSPNGQEKKDEKEGIDQRLIEFECPESRSGFCDKGYDGVEKTLAKHVESFLCLYCFPNLVAEGRSQVLSMNSVVQALFTPFEAFPVGEDDFLGRLEPGKIRRLLRVCSGPPLKGLKNNGDAVTRTDEPGRIAPIAHDPGLDSAVQP